MRAKIGLLPAFLALACVAARGAESLDDAAGRTALEYGQRLQAAAGELSDAREKIAAEQAPLLDDSKNLEDRIIALESEITRMETVQARSAKRREDLVREYEGLSKNLNYITSLAQDNLKILQDALAPGEAQLYSDRIRNFQQELENQGHALDAAAGLDSSEFMLERLNRMVGGYAAPGSSLVGEDNRVVKGTFAFVGPEAFFRADGGSVAGTVRDAGGSIFPVTYPLRSWTSAKSGLLFQGEAGTILADPSGGKALRLRETKGTVLEHVDKGGAVAYIILGLGGVALLIALLKLVDVRNVAADTPQKIRAVLAVVAGGARPEAQAAIGSLRPTCRELFTTGLRYFEAPKTVLEEQLFAVIQRQRLHFERRLPLLATIVTASPLLGLLGTVMGMVKTFALITVFGTGNAAKLSSGISEVLITTELGLMVAIPTLVAHSFLSHRIQHNLSLLERYSTEFVITAEEARAKLEVFEPGRP